VLNSLTIVIAVYNGALNIRNLIVELAWVRAFRLMRNFGQHNLMGRPSSGLREASLSHKEVTAS